MTESEVKTITEQFKAKYLGKYVERVDPNALNQCVDEAIAFAQDLGFPINIFAGVTRAEQIYKTWSNDKFERIANTDTFVPKAGDFCVWDGSLNGGIGHVSNATGEGDTTYFMSIDQNWVVGSPCTLVRHNYDHFLGVQRLKVTNTTMDRRPYWFDLINKVVWNKPYEQVTDGEVNKFVFEYPSQRNRSGKWDKLCLKAGITGDSNQVTVDQLYAKISGGSFDKEAFLEAVKKLLFG